MIQFLNWEQNEGAVCTFFLDRSIILSTTNPNVSSNKLFKCFFPKMQCPAVWFQRIISGQFAQANDRRRGAERTLPDNTVCSSFESLGEIVTRHVFGRNCDSACLWGTPRLRKNPSRQRITVDSNEAILARLNIHRRTGYFRESILMSQQPPCFLCLIESYLCFPEVTKSHCFHKLIGFQFSTIFPP